MPLKRRFKDKYAGSSLENASVVLTLFDLFPCSQKRHFPPPPSLTVSPLPPFNPPQSVQLTHLDAIPVPTRGTIGRGKNSSRKNMMRASKIAQEKIRILEEEKKEKNGKSLDHIQRQSFDQIHGQSQSYIRGQSQESIPRTRHDLGY